MMRSKLEWLRIFTPILITLVLVIVSDIRANVIKVESRMDRLEDKMSVIIERLTKVETKVDISNGKRTLREDMSSLPVKSSGIRTLDGI